MNNNQYKKLNKELSDKLNSLTEEERLEVIEDVRNQVLDSMYIPFIEVHI